MELDDFKQAWKTLEKSLAINERLLRETMLGKARRALAPFVIARAIESVLGVIVTALVMRVLVAHASELRYVYVVGPVAVFAIAMTASCIYLLARSANVDYRGPVAQLQRDVTRLAVTEFHATKWAILGGTLLWLPILLTLFEAVTGVAAIARVDLGYLWANLGVGVVVLVVGHALANRFQGRIADVIGGRSLRRARQYLNDLAEFQVE
jgi:hypothetical protein